MNRILVTSSIPAKSLAEVLRGYPRWAMILDDVWIVRTTKSHIQVRDELRTKYPGYKVLTIDVTSSAWATSSMSDVINNWLKS